MVAPQARGRVGFYLIAVLAAMATLGQWADAVEHASAVRHSEPQLIVDETMGSYCDPLMRTWYVSADALALKRDGVYRPFASLVTRDWTEDTSTTPSTWSSTQSAVSLLGPQDLCFGYRGGWDVLMGRTFDDHNAVEVSYFGLSDWSDTATVADITPFQLDDPTNAAVGASLFSPFTDVTGDPVVGLDYNRLASISYSSRLYGLEWNLRRQLVIPEHWVRGSVLVGGRYMDLREDFTYYSISDLPAGGATNSVDTGTDNEMVGVQVGAEFCFEVEPRCWIDVEIKGGIFDNAASQSTIYVNQSATAYNGTYTSSRSHNCTAGVLDLSLDLTYQCNSFATLKIGYEALWLDGLALAPENVAGADLLVSGYSGLLSNGTAVYHGPRMGVTCAW